MSALPPDVVAATLSLIDEVRPQEIAGSVVIELSFAGPLLRSAVERAGYAHVAPWAADASAGGWQAARHARELGAQLPATAAEPGAFDDLLDGRAVAAIVLVDVLAAGPGADPSWLLSSLHSLALGLGGPPLIVVEENPTHIEVVAALLTGNPRPGRVGRASTPGVFGVGAAQLDDTLRTAGFMPVATRDVSSPEVTPAAPDLHAASSSYTPLGQLLRRVRDGADPYGRVTDFVRAFVAGPARRPVARQASSDYFLSVVIRSQGGRAQHLLETLTCLAAQTDPDLEVLVMVHRGDPGALDRVEAVVDLFEPGFAQRVRVIPVEGGRRGEPLRVGLAEARGWYAAFLDDDDHVTADWVEAFRAGAMRSPGSVVRSRCGEQHYRYVTEPHAVAEWEPTSEFAVTFGDPFDFVDHLYTNHTPIHSFAMPMATVRQLGITADGQIPILEDWGLLMRLAEVCGVHDTGKVTAIYQRWAADDRSHVVITPDVWTSSRTAVLEDFNSAPLLLPTRSALQLVDLANPFRGTPDFRSMRPGAPSLTDNELAARTAAAEAEATTLRHTLDAQRHATVEAQHQAQQLAARVEQFEQSEWWRLTAPMRRLTGRLRRRR